MDKQIINTRMLEINSAIGENKEKVKKLREEMRVLEDTIILQTGALQDCQFWLNEEHRRANAEQANFDPPENGKEVKDVEEKR
jgi:hypothetical protein